MAPFYVILYLISCGIYLSNRNWQEKLLSFSSALLMFVVCPDPTLLTIVSELNALALLLFLLGSLCISKLFYILCIYALSALPFNLSSFQLGLLPVFLSSVHCWSNIFWLIITVYCFWLFHRKSEDHFWISWKGGPCPELFIIHYFFWLTTAQKQWYKEIVICIYTNVALYLDIFHLSLCFYISEV